MQDNKLIKKTLIRYGTTQYKLLNRPRGFFYPLALYNLFIYYTSYQTGQMDFYPLTLLRFAARATKQARWAFLELLWLAQLQNTKYVRQTLVPSDTLMALSFVISLGWVLTIDINYTPPKSQTTLDLHALLVWFTGIIVTLVPRQSENEVP